MAIKTTGQNHFTTEQSTRQRKVGATIPPALKWLLGIATILTFGLAGLSAWAVATEPEIPFVVLERSAPAETRAARPNADAIYAEATRSQSRRQVGQTGFATTDDYLSRAEEIRSSL